MKYLNEYINHMRGNKKSEGTIHEYVRNLTDVFATIGKNEEAVAYEDIENYKLSIASLSSSTINTRISALKSYYKFLMQRRYVEVNPVEYVECPKVKNKEKIPLTGEQVRAMIAKTSNVRMEAFIMALATTGMRIAELASVTIDDYNNRVGNTIIITGKGDKERRVTFPDEAIACIDKYIWSERGIHAAKTGTNLLFVSNQGTALAAGNMGEQLKKIAKEAGIPQWDKVCNHLLRTTCATLALRNGVELPTIQKMLGHSDINTTTRYAKIADETVANAMATMRF